MHGDQRRYVPGWIVALLAAGLVATTWWAWRETAAIHDLRDAAAAQDALVSRAQAEITRLKSLVSSLGDLKARAVAPPVPAKDGAGAAPGAADRGVDLLPYIQKDPLYADLHRRRMLQQVRRRYGDLKFLGLPPDQEARLTLLLSNKMSAFQDGHDAAVAQGIADGTQEMARAINQTAKTADDEIKALVGESGFQDLNTRSSLVTARNSINMALSPYFLPSGQALSLDQLNALADVQNQFKGTPSEFDQAMRDRASQVLTPDQLEIFLQNRTLDQDSRDLQQRATDAAQKETGTTSFRMGNW
jgi:hypothetical protein